MSLETEYKEEGILIYSKLISGEKQNITYAEAKLEIKKSLFENADENFLNETIGEVFADKDENAEVSKESFAELYELVKSAIEIAKAIDKVDVEVSEEAANELLI